MGSGLGIVLSPLTERLPSRLRPIRAQARAPVALTCCRLVVHVAQVWRKVTLRTRPEIDTQLVLGEMVYQWLSTGSVNHWLRTTTYCLIDGCSWLMNHWPFNYLPTDYQLLLMVYSWPIISLDYG